MKTNTITENADTQAQFSFIDAVIDDQITDTSTQGSVAPATEQADESEPDEINKVLTETEHEELKSCEGEVENHNRSFIRAGDALEKIRHQLLYREKHKTFEKYCEDRWGYEPKPGLPTD